MQLKVFFLVQIVYFVLFRLLLLFKQAMLMYCSDVLGPLSNPLVCHLSMGLFKTECSKLCPVLALQLVVILVYLFPYSCFCVQVGRNKVLEDTGIVLPDSSLVCCIHFWRVLFFLWVFFFFLQFKEDSVID